MGSARFDAFGNRTSMTVGTDETTYTHDDADRLASVDPPAASAISYTWDDNGSLTARGSDTFVWDYEERMTSGTVNSVTTTFAYRGDGLRDSRTTGMATTTFTWDIAAGLPVVIDDGNRYVYGAGLEAQVSGSNTYYYLADGLGSTMKTVDASGNVVNSYTYDVYGKKTISTGSQANEFDFAGQQTDPTGLQYLRARYMDPETGVLLSREPLARTPGWVGGGHGYGAANPTRYADPSGLAVADSGDGGPSWAIQPPPRTDPDGPGGLEAVNPVPGTFWEDYVRPDGKWSIHLCQYVQRGTASGWSKDCGDSGVAVTIGEYDRCSLNVGKNQQNFGFQAILCVNGKTGDFHTDIKITSTPDNFIAACVKGAVFSLVVTGVATGVAVATGFVAAPGSGAVAVTVTSTAMSGCAGGILEELYDVF
jgi:RHS repeat-associated protein